MSGGSGPRGPLAAVDRALRRRGLDIRRPLDRVGSVKLKLGISITAAVALGSLNTLFGVADGLPRWAGAVLRLTAGLAVVAVLTRGMTSPLREMAEAAQAMAAGQWGRRVADTSADEVGELARAFNAMAAELAATDRMRRDLIANVSHELRTPISALHARLENLVDGVERPEPELLTAMLDQAQRLGRLVAQLLDLSRLESGAVPLHREVVEVTSALDAVADEARLADPSRRVEVDVRPPGLEVDADPDRLHQVLANLTTNALRHSPADRPVRLTACQVGGDVVLAVADEGPGIPAADAERVFERFYRADPSRHGSTADGAGLGLAIAREIVHLHAGTIHVTSAPGCTFTVHLPTTDRSASPVVPAAVSPTAVTGASTAPG